MNIRKIITSALVGATMLASVVGPAAAAQIDINIYGASAQFTYWTAASNGILTNQGCTVNSYAKTTDGKHAISQATCNSGADTVNLRVSSKASYEGLYSLLGNTTYANVTSEKCNAGDATVDGVVLTTANAGYYRKMADAASCTVGTFASPGSCSATKCARVTVGVSDVAGKSFTQNSHGALAGPLGGAQTDRTFSSITAPANLHPYNPIVVPFGFFVNNSVKRCADGDIATSATTCTSAAVPQPLANLPRSMAVQIFSGQAYEWQDFGDEFVPGLPVVACLRHAGSGTAATLAYAVMNNKWGAPMATTQSTSAPIIYFNDGTPDEMACINVAGTGAIGYADADQANSANTVGPLKYNGELPTRINIRNGRYDFWTNEWAYEDTTAPAYATTHPYVSSMMAYAANPVNIPAAKALYWATNAELNWDKVSDQTYPGYVGCDAGSCQTP